MKKLILGLFLLLGVLHLNAQKIAPTTEEEYNYVTKGYRIQQESGLDDKRGYRWEDLTSHYTDNGIRTMKFKALYRIGESKPCAVLLIYKNLDTRDTEYFCIPTYDAPKELWLRTHERTKTCQLAASYAIIWGVMHAMAFFAQ